MPEPVYVTYFTDPLCSWSWAFEPTWRRLLWEFGSLLRYRYRMAGLITDWRRYQDPINNVNRPAHMAPCWLEIQRQTGAPFNLDLWHRNPPASSHPACIAQKAAEIIGLDFGEHYLRRLREAAMLEARNLSEANELIAIAEIAHDEFSSEEAIDFEEFLAGFQSPQAEAAFREDLKEVRFLEIGRFPTVIFHRPSNMGLALTGFRPFSALREGLSHFAPEMVSLAEEATPIPLKDLKAYLTRWRRATYHELMENFSLPFQTLQAEVESLNLTKMVTAEHDLPKEFASQELKDEAAIRWD